MTHYKLCNSCGELFEVKDAQRDFLCPECEQLPIDIEGKDTMMEYIRECEDARVLCPDCYDEAEEEEEKRKQELMESIVVDMLKKVEGELDEASKERLWKIIKKKAEVRSGVQGSEKWK